LTLHTQDRRSALVRLVLAGTGLITGALAALVGLVAAPQATAHDKRWRRVISLNELADDGPTQAVLAERHADGWYQTRRQSVVFIDREGDGYRVLSATCSHLGCRVRWDTDSTQFRCPCHGGVYDRDGRVVSGPPPAPLARLAARVNPETSDLEVEL
jgi:menaquinol-cytochrome c reductase iron-sulfur subunit